jgi:hypothetical protein
MEIKLTCLKCRFFFPFLLLIVFQSHAEGLGGGKIRDGLADTSGIVISAGQFDALVGSLLIKFKSDTSNKTIEDYILLVKVCNTIAYDRLSDSCNECNELYNLYVFKYFKIAVKVTDATVYVGYDCYSKKYDLQFGGRKKKNNHFQIIH